MSSTSSGSPTPTCALNAKIRALRLARQILVHRELYPDITDAATALALDGSGQVGAGEERRQATV
jgi:hypothetical protein